MQVLHTNFGSLINTKTRIGAEKLPDLDLQTTRINSPGLPQPNPRIEIHRNASDERASTLNSEANQAISSASVYSELTDKILGQSNSWTKELLNFIDSIIELINLSMIQK